MSTRGRILIVVRPLDRVLLVLRFVLLPLAAVVVSLPTLSLLAPDLKVTANVWLVATAALVIFALQAVLLQAPSVRSRIDRFFASLRRRVAMSCDLATKASRPDRRISCRLTPEILRAPLFRYPRQQEAVDNLVEACRTGSPGRYWVVEGDSGTGKTRTALLLVHTLISDRDLFELATRCYLYDFAGHASVQDELLSVLGSWRREQSVVLVDNFHRVRPDVLRELTFRFLDRPKAPAERLILFLARPAAEWSLAPGSDVRLVSAAKAAGRYVELEGPPAELVARSVSLIDVSASQLVRDVGPATIASATQLHLAQVIARNRGAPPDVMAMLRMLQEKTNSTESPDLVHVLALVCALSMHRALFSPREFRRAAAAAAGQSTTGRLVCRIRSRLMLRRLSRLGIVPKIHLDGTRYVFHEDIAEQCIDQLTHWPAFNLPFTAAARTMLLHHRAVGHALATWLTAVEIGDEDETRRAFDDALSSGAYAQMERCLRRADARYRIADDVRLQLAILLDRTGHFAESRAEFTDELVARVGTDPGLGAILLATRVEASHDDKSVVGLDVMTAHPDRLIALIGKYWELHIAGHHGRFDAEGLLALAVEALPLVQGRESHWLLYSLARMHFDSLRHHYLAGGLPANEVVRPERRVLSDYLRPRLPIFEPLDTLYTKAHLVSHVLIPQAAIFREPVSREDAALAGVEGVDLSSNALVLAAQGHYRRARDQFAQYGDREALYTDGDIVNAELMRHDVDLNLVLEGVEKYAGFIRSTGFPSIASYPHLGYARWHMRNYYDLLTHPPTPDMRIIDDHFDEARRHLRLVKKLDATARNDYGVLRAEILLLLVELTRGDLQPKRVAVLRRRAVKGGYGFESRLLDRLAEGPSVQLVAAATRYYPAVWQ